MTDNRLKDRVKLMLNGTPHDMTHPESLPMPQIPAPDPAHPNQALQVLTLAQRTADEHIHSAHRHADRIRADATAAAEQIAREAHTYAQNVRLEADKIMTKARATAEQAELEAQTIAEEAQRHSEKIMSEAHRRAEAVVVEAEDQAEELRQRAERRYEDVVGSLSTKREALQRQIEAMERFDHEYRARLTSFMQGQLRALWVDEPQVTEDFDEQQLDSWDDSPHPQVDVAIPAQRLAPEPAIGSLQDATED